MTLGSGRHKLAQTLTPHNLGIGGWKIFFNCFCVSPEGVTKVFRPVLTVVNNHDDNIFVVVHTK